MKLLTNLIFEPKGKHDPALAYTIKDTVMSADGSKVYFALQDVPAGTALNNEDYWKLQIDLSGSKSAMDEALASFSNYAKIVGTRVRGETAKVSGNPAAFLPDAGSLLQPVTVLEPKQQGSGDPYPAGGGKNLCLPLSGVKTEQGVTFTPNADGSVTVSGTATAQVAVGTSQFVLKAGTYTVSGAPAGSALASYDIYVYKADGTGTIARSYGGINQSFTLTEDINVALAMRVPAGAVDTTKVFWPMIEAGSTATKFAPYSNIRPITGYDALGLTRVGKNLFTGWIRGEKINSVTGAIEITSDAARTGYIPVVPSKQIEISGLTDTLYNFVAFYDEAKNFVSRSNAAGLNAVTIRTPDNCAYIAITQYENINVTGTIADLKDTVQIEYGASVTEYTPHAGMDTYTVQIGQTVYGGRFDWLTGKLTKIWPVVTLRNLTISYKGGDHNYFEINMPTDALATADFLCESYKNVGVLYYSSMPTTPTGCMGYYPQDRVWRLKDTRYTSVDELLAGNGDMKIAYKLAVPIEIQLTPHIISAADPEQVNTLYGDGRIDVEYVKPLHVSIEERVAAALAAAKE